VGTNNARARKKSATARTIVDAAMTLFAKRGFAATTIDDIAERAGIGRRTFFRYFPTKEDIVLDPRRIDGVFLRAALRSRPAGVSELDHLMDVLAEVQRRAFDVFRPEHQRALHRLSHDEAALAARSFILMQHVRDLVVGALLPPRAPRAARMRLRLLAMSCIVAVDVSVTHWVEGDMREDLGQILRRSSALLRHGFAVRTRGSSR
jgi:AcrR family transcriptional regulator